MKRYVLAGLMTFFVAAGSLQLISGDLCNRCYGAYDICVARCNGDTACILDRCETRFNACMEACQ